MRTTYSLLSVATRYVSEATSINSNSLSLDTLGKMGLRRLINSASLSAIPAYSFGGDKLSTDYFWLEAAKPLFCLLKTNSIHAIIVSTTFLGWAGHG